MPLITPVATGAGSGRLNCALIAHACTARSQAGRSARLVVDIVALRAKGYGLIGHTNVLQLAKNVRARSPIISVADQMRPSGPTTEAL